MASLPSLGPTDGAAVGAAGLSPVESVAVESVAVESVAVESAAVQVDGPGGADDIDGPEALEALLKSRNYAGLRVVMPYLGLTADSRRLGDALCAYATSVVDMDAEDWGNLTGVPEDLLEMVRTAHMPQRADDPERGALRSLVPTYGLFLESLDTRWLRADLFGALAVVHLMGEYLPLLAWEPLLGHAGDPRELPVDVGGEHSRWGSDSGTVEGRRCDHSPSIRGALRVALRIGFPEQNGGPEQGRQGWLTYLDRDHSRVSGALSQCGLHVDPSRPNAGRECRNPCSVWFRHSEADREALADRLTLAALYVEGPLVALRHAAPVGHGFGIPDEVEIKAAWERTWKQITKPWAGRTNPMHGLRLDDLKSDVEPLAGLSTFLTHVAGRPIHPWGVLDRVDALLAEVVQL